MKKLYPILTFILILTSAFIIPHFAHAQTALVNYFLEKIAVIWLTIASFITGVIGVALNGVVYYTIVKVYDNYSNLPVIEDTWKVVRDIANMSFIFVLLYAAIQTMLGKSKDTQKLIVRVIMVAILINFSLFFTKVVIDTANILSITFYGAIAPDSLNNVGFLETGLSNAFMDKLGVSSLYKLAANNSIKGTGMIVTIGVMGSIVLLITAFVFFAIALMLIIRYVALIFVLIFSPIAFLSFVLPQLDKTFKNWKDTLIGQSFFAPIYFMLTWVALKLLDGIFGADVFRTGGGDPSGNLGGVGFVSSGEGIQVGGGAGFFSTFITYCLVIAFIIISLKEAKKWSGKAAFGIDNLTNMAMSAAGGAVLGGAGFAARRTIGKAATTLSESEGLKDAASKRGATGWLARNVALKGSTAIAGASFDLRATRLGGQLNAGKASGKGGFAKFRDNQAKKAADKAKELSSVSEEVLYQANQAVANAKTPEEKEAAQRELEQITGVSKGVMAGRERKEIDDSLETDEELKRAKAEAESVERLLAEKEKAVNDTVIPQQRKERAAEVEKMRQRLNDAKKAAEERQKAVEKTIKTKYRGEANDKGEFGEVRAIESSSSRRKRNFTEVVENSWLEKIKGTNQAAAARLRKADKGKKDKAFEALKEYVEEQQASEGGEPPKKEAPTPPSGGNSGGNPPPNP